MHTLKILPPVHCVAITHLGQNPQQPRIPKHELQRGNDGSSSTILLSHPSPIPY